MSKQSKKITLNSAFLLSGKGIEFIATLLAAVLLARYLGTAGYGEFAFVRACGFILMPFIGWGGFNIIIRDISVDMDRAGSLINNSILLNIISCMVCLLIAWTYFIVSGLSVIKLQLPICLIIIAQTLLTIQRNMSVIFIATEKMQYHAVLQAFQRFFIVILYLIVILLKLEMIYIFIAIFLNNFLVLTLTWWIVSKELTVKYTYWHLKELSYLVTESYVLMLSNLMQEGRSYANIFFLKAISTFEQVSLFQLPHRIITPFQVIPRSVMLSLFPMFSRLGKKGVEDAAALHNLYEGMVKYTVLLFTPLCLLICLLAEPIVILLFGEEFRSAASPLMIIIWGLWFFSISNVMQSLVISLRNQRAVGVSNFLALIMNIIAAVIFIPKYGALGASIAFVSGNFIQFLVLYILVRKILKKAKLLKLIYQPIITCALLTVIIIGLSPWLHMFLMAPLALLLYVWYIFKSNYLNDDERLYIKKVQKKIKSIFRQKKTSPIIRP